MPQTKRTAHMHSTYLHQSFLQSLYDAVFDCDIWYCLWLIEIWWVWGVLMIDHFKQRQADTISHVISPWFPSSTSASRTSPSRDPNPNDVDRSCAYTIRQQPGATSSNVSTIKRRSRSGELSPTRSLKNMELALFVLFISYWFSSVPKKSSLVCFSGRRVSPHIVFASMCVCDLNPWGFRPLCTCLRGCNNDATVSTWNVRRSRRLQSRHVNMLMMHLILREDCLMLHTNYISIICQALTLLLSNYNTSTAFLNFGSAIFHLWSFVHFRFVPAPVSTTKDTLPTHT